MGLIPGDGMLRRLGRDRLVRGPRQETEQPDGAKRRQLRALENWAAACSWACRVASSAACVADCACAFARASRIDACACCPCLLYTSDAADDLLCVDLGGRCIIKKKVDTDAKTWMGCITHQYAKLVQCGTH